MENIVKNKYSTKIICFQICYNLGIDLNFNFKKKWIANGNFFLKIILKSS